MLNTKKKLLYIGYAVVTLLTVLALIFTICVLKNMAETGNDFSDALGAAFLIIYCIMLLPGVLLVEFEVFYIFKYFLFSQHKTKAQTIINIACLALPFFTFVIIFLILLQSYGDTAAILYFLWLGAQLLFRLGYFTVRGTRRGKVQQVK